MAHFYLTLPSNSSTHYYPNNTVTRYTTRLENSISLSGDWEVGLVEIQYQHTWFNLEKGEGRVTYSQIVDINDKPVHMQNTIRLPPGYYDSPVDLIQIVNDHIEDTADKFKLTHFTKFKYNSVTKRLSADVNKGANIFFSPALCAMLGIGGRQNPIVNKDEAL